jgi:glycosyltransferase involved in cell wall biosynthesis
MSADVLASVAMITYNHASYIAEAIEGVLSQETDFPIELVIGEDCSTDGTRAIVFDYQKRHPDLIRVIACDENVGMIANILRTERACRGKYVAYCEGDDFWHHPQKLQKQVDFLEKNPEYGLVHSDADYLFAASGTRMPSVQRASGYWYHSKDRETPYLALLEVAQPIITCTACVNRKLLLSVIDGNRMELQTERFHVGDLPRWLELSRVARFGFIPESLATYRVLAESAIHTRIPEKRLRLFTAGREMRSHYLNKYDCPPDVRKRIVVQDNQWLLMSAYHARNVTAAADAYHELGKAGALSRWHGLLFLAVRAPVMRVVVAPMLFLRRVALFARRCLSAPMTAVQHALVRRRLGRWFRRST